MPTSQLRTRASNCALLTVSVICMCVLVVCGVMIVREYSLSQGYMATDCTMVGVETVNEKMPCKFCGTSGKDGINKKGAGSCLTSSFPCVRIIVKYNNGRASGVIHPDSLQITSAYSQCSFDVCLRSPAENQAAVDKHTDSYRAKGNSTFKCFYNSENPSEVIALKKYTTYNVIHSMLWPSLIICVCGIIFVKLEMKRRGLKFCSDGTLDGSAYKDPKATMASVNNGKHMVVAKYKMSKEHGNNVECKLTSPACSLLKQESGKALSSSLSSLDRLVKTNEQKRSQLGTKQAHGGSTNHVHRLSPEAWKGALGTSNQADDKSKNKAISTDSEQKLLDETSQRSPPTIPSIKVRAPNERTSSTESRDSHRSSQSGCFRAETPV